ncbi:iron-regulated protein A precursor [Shewanella sp. OPT22]|nr:iron-regulated protein A precursor [Shewanella sp. OPT22]
MIKKTLLAASLAALLAGCGGSGTKSDSDDNNQTSGNFDFAATEMITNITDDVIVAGYSELATKAGDLHLATITLWNSPSAESLKAAQDAWKNARKPWEQGESHIFGPVDSLEIDPHLDSWPLATDALAKQLNDNTSFDADIIRGWNDNLQGFHAMEYLLFGDGVQNNVKPIADMTQKEREYLVELAVVFKGYAEDLENAWKVEFDAGNSTSPYADRLKNPGDNSNYSSQVAVIEELILGMIGIVDEVGNGKIAEPFGTDASNADTSKVESQYSWNSLTDFSNNIKGVKNVWEGEFSGNADEQGIVNFVAAADSAVAIRVSREIDTAITAILDIEGGIGMPFRQAITDADGRQRIQTAIDALTTLQSSLENDVQPLKEKWNGK